jgi:flagellar biosynthesis protein
MADEVHTQSAVALRYPDGVDAPFIMLKTRGELVKYLVELAEERNIPVIKNPALMEVLTLYDVGEYIPPETYEIVAGIFAFIRRIETNGGCSGNQQF